MPGAAGPALVAVLLETTGLWSLVWGIIAACFVALRTADRETGPPETSDGVEASLGGVQVVETLRHFGLGKCGGMKQIWSRNLCFFFRNQLRDIKG